MTTTKILAIADVDARTGLDRNNYRALEEGEKHALTESDIERAGGAWYASLHEAHCALVAAGGGWTFDDDLCSTWHSPT